MVALTIGTLRTRSQPKVKSGSFGLLPPAAAVRPASTGLALSVQRWTSLAFPKSPLRTSAAAFRILVLAVLWLPIWVATPFSPGDSGQLAGLPNRVAKRLLRVAVQALAHGKGRSGPVMVVRNADDDRVDFAAHGVEHHTIIVEGGRSRCSIIALERAVASTSQIAAVAPNSAAAAIPLQPLPPAPMIPNRNCPSGRATGVCAASNYPTAIPTIAAAEPFKTDLRDTFPAISYSRTL